MFDRINNSPLNASEWVKVYDPDPLIIKKNCNTEHFLSQNPDYTVPEEDMEVGDNIGNLFIISRHTNSHLQNKPPAEKIPLLKERGKNLRYVMEFVDAFEAGSQKWGRPEIANRASELAMKSYGQVWNIVQFLSLGQSSRGSHFCQTKAMSGSSRTSSVVRPSQSWSSP